MRKIQKNKTQELRVERTEYQGHDLVSLRIWFAGDDGQMRPGKGGFALRVALVPDLVAAIESEMGFGKDRQGKLQIVGGDK